MANGPPSENSPSWLKPLVTPLTVGRRHFSTCPGAELLHVGALGRIVSLQPDSDIQKLLLNENRCQAKFLTCETSGFTPCTHAQSGTLHIEYAEKTDD